MIKNLKIYEKIKGCKKRIVSFALAGTMIFSGMVTEVNGKSYNDKEPFSIEEIEDIERITKEKVTRNDQVVKYKNFISALNILANKEIIFRRSERKDIYNQLNCTGVPYMVKQISDRYITEEELNKLNNEFIDLIKHEIELDELYKKDSLLNKIDFDFIPTFVLFLN